MKYEEFLQALKAAGIDYDPYLSFNIDQLFRYAWNNTKGAVPVLVQYWKTGGRTGGNCWGGEAKEYTTNEVPPVDFKDLDKALEILTPGITLLQYKRVCAEVVRSGTDRVYEYYGNREDYAYRFVELPQIYAALVKMKLLEP